MEPGEKKIWDSLKVTTKAFSAAQGLAGERKIAQIGQFKTVPDQEVENYVNRIGQQLIPEYQRSLAPNDSGKIPFRFFVVQKTPNAFALPNGIVVIHSSMFDTSTTRLNSRPSWATRLRMRFKSTHGVASSTRKASERCWPLEQRSPLPTDNMPCRMP